MPLSPDIVNKDNMRSGCPSATFVHLFVRAVLVTMISHEWLEQSWRNLQRIFISPYWWHD